MRDQRSTTGKQRYPAFNGRIIVDTYRGQTRVRSWPRPTGTPASEQVRDQNAWFKAVNQLAMRADPSQMKLAIESVRNTGLYPRDLIVRAIGQGLIDIIDETGRLITYRQRFWSPIMFQGAIIRPTSPITPGVNVWTGLSWPPPLIDTASFWDPAEPTRLTIPDHIEIVEVYCCIKQNASASALLATRIVRNDTVDVAWSQATSSGTVGDHVSTGPLPVVQGDYFEVFTFPTRAGDFPVGPTWYGLAVLQAQ